MAAALAPPALFMLPRGEPVGHIAFDRSLWSRRSTLSVRVHSAWLRLKNASLPHLSPCLASRPSVRHVCRAMHAHDRHTIRRDEACIGVEVGLHLIDTAFSSHIRRLAAFDAIRNSRPATSAPHIPVPVAETAANGDAWIPQPGKAYRPRSPPVSL